jgi:hypothetical protein
MRDDLSHRDRARRPVAARQQNMIKLPASAHIKATVDTGSVT